MLSRRQLACSCEIAGQTACRMAHQPSTSHNASSLPLQLFNSQLSPSHNLSLPSTTLFFPFEKAHCLPGSGRATVKHARSIFVNVLGRRSAYGDAWAFFPEKIIRDTVDLAGERHLMPRDTSRRTPFSSEETNYRNKVRNKVVISRAICFTHSNK